jgi:hypothetical protein
MLKNQKKIDEKMLRISDMGPKLRQMVFLATHALQDRHFEINRIALECDNRSSLAPKRRGQTDLLGY